MGNERKSIFITGAASGMGEATAKLFAGNGWFVGIYDVNGPGLKALASEIGDENCHSTLLDVTELSAYRSALEHFGVRTGNRLDVRRNPAHERGDRHGAHRQMTCQSTATSSSC